VSAEDLEKYETEMELQLYREYRDVVGLFSYVVETERRFYLANGVELIPKGDGWLEVALTDAWVWDMFRTGRFVSSVRVMTRRDVNVEELRREDDLFTVKTCFYGHHGTTPSGLSFVHPTAVNQTDIPHLASLALPAGDPAFLLNAQALRIGGGFR